MRLHAALRSALASLGACGALLAGCAAPAPPDCPAGLQAMKSETLYFGTERPGGTVAAADWQAFVDGTVTPRFPQGLSVWPAAGQWRNGRGLIVSEAAHVLNIVHAGSAAQDRALQDIVAAYKARFQQEAVLRVQSAVCVSF
jgi:hypothetical protein